MHKTLWLILAALALCVSSTAIAQTLTSDRDDYAPGEIATFTGTGFEAGESVHMQVLHADGTPDDGEDHDSWILAADEQGAFVTTWHVCEDDCIGSTLKASAEGQMSGLHAEVLFTDSPKVGSVSVAAQTGTATYGTAGSVTYLITVNRGTGGGSNGAFTATLTVTTVLPTGASASFSPNPVSFTSGDNSKTATLTITMSASVLAGTTSFTVRAATSASDNASGTGSLKADKRTLTGSIAVASKAYNGTNGATITSRSLSGVVGSDDVSYVGGTGSFADKNAGNGKTVSATGLTLSGTAAANYTVNSVATTSANITPRGLVVSASGVNKTYDGTTTAAVSLSDDRIAGDMLTHSYASAAFGDKNVGNSKPVSVSGIAISGTDAGNYSANSSATATADITPRGLVVSASGVNKAYDGTSAASVTLSDDRVAGDALSHNYAGAAFSDKNAGNAKSVSVSGIGISGADAANYSANTDATASADITPRGLVVSASGVNKTYDATSDASVTLSDDRVAGDALNDGYTSAAFGDKNVGNGKPVSVSGISISGADAANYSANTDATASADITPRSLVVSAGGVNKIYDGTSAASVTLSDDRVAGDALSDGYASAAFSDKNVGNGKPVSVSGIVVSGADAGNYSANTDANTSADITPRGLVVSASGVNKIYDGTSAASVTLSDDRVASDVLTDNYTSAAFSDKNVGNGKPVSVSGISISGADAANYSANTDAATSANITPRGLVVSASGVNKIYDGTSAASVTFSDDRVAGDSLSDGYASAAFSDKNVGNGKPVSVSGISISGTDAANYSANTDAATSANITPRGLVVSASGLNKAYDGTSAASVTLSDDRVAGDALSDGYASAAFSDKNVGNGKPVSVSGIGISGTDAANYSANTDATASADITPRGLVVSASGVNKIYDGTSTAAVTLSDDRVAGDALSHGYASAAFSDKNVGNSKPVSVSGISVSGADAGNYSANSSATTTADITPRGLVVSANGVSKTYDATTTAAVTLSDNRVAGDMLSHSYASAAFSDKNVGNGKPVSVSGISITGADAANYSANSNAATSAEITPRSLVVSASGVNKTYDGTTAATVILSDNRVAGDVLSDGYANAVFNNKDVGVGKPVSVSGISVSGSDAGNYAFNVTATATADIVPATLTVRADNKTRLACQTNPLLTAGISGFVSGETMASSGVSGLPGLSTTASQTSPVGSYPITAAAGTLMANNYQFSFVNGTLTVTSNSAPVASLTNPTGSANIFQVNAPVLFKGTWTDNAGDTHVAQLLFDGIPATDPVTVSGDPTGSGTISAYHTFTAAGVYMVTLRVSDQCGGVGQSSQVAGLDAMVVVYDPSVGFVTGGGWINSPPGAFRADTSLVGKANFGFESKYAKGAKTPTGETEFQFKVGNLNFHSTAYEWLVISGPNAQYKGSGTINGIVGYDFMLTARDEQINGGGSTDKFRMRITHHQTGALVYDNQLGSPDTASASTALGGGSIVIHAVPLGRGVPTNSMVTLEPTLETATSVEYSLAQNAPNPFQKSTAIGFSLPVKSAVRLTVFDIAGREVASLADGEWDQGRHVVTWSGATKNGHIVNGGVYFVRLSAQSTSGTESFSSLKKMIVLQ